MRCASCPGDAHVPLCAGSVSGTPALPHLKTQVELNLAKPNYRHQKKQKEQARKLRQAEKQTRRLAARADGSDLPTDTGTVADGAIVLPEGMAPVPAES